MNNKRQLHLLWLLTHGFGNHGPFRVLFWKHHVCPLEPCQRQQKVRMTENSSWPNHVMMIDTPYKLSFRYMVAVSRCENNFARFCTQVWNEFFDNSTTSIEVTQDEFDACTMYTLKVSHSKLASFDWLTRASKTGATIVTQDGWFFVRFSLAIYLITSRLMVTLVCLLTDRS